MMRRVPMLFKIARRNFVAGRTFNASHSIGVYQLKMENTTEPKEIMIPVPFGHLAGKVWNEGGIPLLSLHGWMDNAGTWDGVAPLLPRDISLVAIDFPGHGLSSSMPLGTGGTFIDLLLTIERIVQHFEWKEVNLLGHSMGGGAAMLYAGTFPEKIKKVNLLGHSMGGGAAMLYAGTFPEKIKKVIMVDMIKPIATPAENQPERTARGIRGLLEAETKIAKNPPCYDYSAIVNKLIKGYNSSITEEAAQVLLKRGSVKHPNGLYSFNYDPRLKTSNIFGMTLEQEKEFANRLNCELMIIIASKGPFYEKKEMYDEMLSNYNKSAKKFIYKEVEGTHHVHINDPQVIAPIIAKFIHGV